MYSKNENSLDNFSKIHSTFVENYGEFDRNGVIFVKTNRTTNEDIAQSSSNVNEFDNLDL